MNKQPPKHLLTFFLWFCHPDYVEDIEGDLLERFEKKPSRWLFAWEILKLLRPGIIRNFEGTRKLNYYGMIKHYFLVSIRSFKREKSYTIINLIGLTIAVTASLLIWQYVYDQKQCDNYHLNSDHKYRINYSYFKGEEFQLKSALTTYSVGEEVRDNLPGVKNMVRVRPIFSDEGLVISNGSGTKKFLEYQAYYVETSFLNFFNYPLESGNPDDVLASPNNIVLTDETAKKLFGSHDPVGESLHVSAGNLTGDFIVSGVLKKLPAGTHLDFDYLIPIDFLLAHYGLYLRSDGWQWENFYTYLELEDQTDSKELSTQLDELIYTKIGHNLDETHRSLQTSFQPIRNIYLDSFIDGDGGLFKGNTTSIVVFPIIAIVIVIIAGINYVNLASARSLIRKSQVYLRKAIGASKCQLTTQFLFESFLFNLIALALGLQLAYLLMPSFSAIIGSEKAFSLIYDIQFWITIILVLTIISMLTGWYPALLSLRLARIRTAKNQINTTVKGILFRKSLIVFQLMISLVLVSGTWLVYKQITFVKSRELGMKMEQIFVIQGPRVVIEEGRDVMKQKNERFKNTLLANSSIRAISSTSNVPGTGEIWYGGIRKLGDPREEEINAEAILVDKEFTNTYDFVFLAGEPFTAGMADYEAVIINESALIKLGLQKPSEALMHNVVLENLDTMKIHGVVKDVHWNSLHEPIGPMIFGINNFPAFLSIKLTTNDLSETLKLIGDTYTELYPKDPYIAYFLDEDFNRQYQSEQKFGQIFSVFAIIAVVISSMGLFAVIAFSLSQKIKEIGIRKVLGASVSQLFQYLSREYLLLFLVSFGIATPLIYWGSHHWLENFAYRIEIGLELFILPAFMVGSIMALVISKKIIVAAKVNPVDQLKNE